jgi:Rieske Fe-S protein
MTQPHRKDDPGEATSRRAVLAGGVMVAGTAALAACGTSAPPSSAGQGAGGASPSPLSGIPTSDVPVAGGKVIPDARVVITQPAAGTFKAFDAICPHAGCEVSDIVKNVIYCPCHGSTFDATTGAHIAGPSPRGLTPLPVTVSGSTISVQ